MKESLLHLVWENKWFTSAKLFTTKKEELYIHQTGNHNLLQGPDFSNAIIEIGGQKWAGNVEIHVKSSDWYAHQHEKDENYQKVILHVVYEHDVEVYDLHSNEIPTLELKECILPKVLENYEDLIQNPKGWIFCNDSLKDYDAFKLSNWLESMYVERLERKVGEIEAIYNACGKDWEATLFLVLAKYFGGNLNGGYFVETFSKIDFSLIRKATTNKVTESLLFGLLGLLKKDIEDPYYQTLQNEFLFQSQKYKLASLLEVKLNFYGGRPQNFPTIRLAQLIALYEDKQTVFASVLELGDKVENYRTFFRVEVNKYWQTHYNYDKLSKKSPKKVSNGFVDLLLMNAVIPVLFLYSKLKGEDNSHLLELMYAIAPEKNRIITMFQKKGCKANSALQSQALLTLKKEYCEKERCTECAIGVDLISTTSGTSSDLLR